MLLIGGVMFSSLEYSGKISLVIFTGGCLLRCPYCHNPEIVEGGKSVSLREIKNEILEAVDFIDAVVITGGEPLMQHQDVGKIFKFAKDLDLNTKLDTNGCYPEKLVELTDFLDYVALDVKAPFHKYNEIIGNDVGDEVKRSMEIAYKASCFLECRTTYVPGLMEPKDILEIAQNIKCDLYTIQQFRNRVVLDIELHKTPNPSRNELMEIAQNVRPFIRRVKIKTEEFGDEVVS